MRQRRADRSVVLFDRSMAALERSSSVRYVFGSYDPYRALPGARRGRGREVDHSYVAAGDEVGGSKTYPAVAGNRELDETDPFDDTNDEDDVATALAETDAAPRNRAAGYQGSRSGRRDATDRGVRRRRAPRHPREVVELVAASGQGSSGPARGGQPSTGGAIGRERSAANERPAPTAAERRASRNSRVALQRRRQIFFSLLGAFVLSLAAAIVLGTAALWGAHAATVLLFAGYLSLLARHQHRMAERATKVRRIVPEERQAPLERPGVVLVSGGSGR